MLFIYGFLVGAVLTTIIALFIALILLKQSKVFIHEELKEKSGELKIQSEESLKTILDPVKERLIEYQKSFEEAYQKEAKERFALKKEIDSLTQSSRQVELEAHKLSKTLKGDVKSQGVWGEMVLDRILELSGLEKGREYETQSFFKDISGTRLRPDAIVFLPDDHHIVIDSKVSLTHYMEYVGAEDQNKKEENLKLLRRSFLNHIDSLASKEYQALEGIKSPDFIFLFIPLESAYSIISRKFPEIFEGAWSKKIVLTTPSTLMASLKTVSSVWRIEKQAKNAEDIAKKAGLLYDKFVGLYSDLEKVGDSLNKSQKSYHAAISKLKDGRGNLVDKANELKELGAKANKTLN
jgi:DNA recombination protein RmuC